MSTTARPRGTGRGRASSERDAAVQPRDEFDLLTAAALGVVVGAGLALLVRRGPRGSRPIGEATRATARGARRAAKAGMRGARWAAERGEEMWDGIPFDEIGESIGEYLRTAREAIDDAVAHELRDLRKAVRRQRKRLGV